MADINIKLWGIFPWENQWGVFKFNLKKPEAVFAERWQAHDWASVHADPDDFSILREAGQDGKKGCDWMRLPAGKSIGREDYTQITDQVNRMKFLVEN